MGRTGRRQPTRAEYDYKTHRAVVIANTVRVPLMLLCAAIVALVITLPLMQLRRGFEAAAGKQTVISVSIAVTITAALAITTTITTTYSYLSRREVRRQRSQIIELKSELSDAREQLKVVEDSRTARPVTSQRATARESS